MDAKRYQAIDRKLKDLIVRKGMGVTKEMLHESPNGIYIEEHISQTVKRRRQL